MKLRRQNKVLELISKYDVETQEMLADLLYKAGYEVTQATVSRDIRELKLTKVAMGNGKQKYVAIMRDTVSANDRLKRVFKEGVVSIDYAQNIIVVKTLVGMAMAVAAAIDAMNNDEIMGTIAGDDTIFCAVKSERIAMTIVQRLGGMIAAEK